MNYEAAYQKVKEFGQEHILKYYEELTEKMNAHPTFTLVIKEPKKKSDKPKRTYFGMDFKFMEKYISIQKNYHHTMMMEFSSMTQWDLEKFVRKPKN